ncbi:Ger(x)C family spore germination protein [Saliterribacillus persicus]|uniref:Ger(X)C family germination protein n=1 Tax=Saliterribacillus persicus TaxID=930114 RepID=A0A368YCL3_9BACI|nr:Ger(x)C family spore germination protein [Saliterribacillus persicus]RCW77168.1 Ger(x)C family germination protein [Saliterribacillus persicus]
MTNTKVCFIILSLFLLTGCWDQHLLKNTRLIYGMAFDLDAENKIEETIVIRSIPINPDTGMANEVVSAVGDTINDTRKLINEKISGEYGGSKNQVVLLGSELAKIDIYPFLDNFYREPLSPLSAKLGVVQGKAGDIISLKEKDQNLIAEYLTELIRNGEEKRILPIQSIQTICTHMFDEGKDFGLPLLQFDPKNRAVEIQGLALFDGKKYTENFLTPDQSSIMMLLSGEAKSGTEFTYKVNEENKENWVYNYVSFQVLKAKVKKTISSTSSNDFSVQLGLDLAIEIDEYPKDHLFDEAYAKELKTKIKKQMGEDAEEVISLLQEANSDVFGYGRDLLAYHSKQLQGNKLEKGYFKKLDIQSKIEVTIEQAGVIY